MRGCWPRHQQEAERHNTGERACPGWIWRLTRPGNKTQSIDAQAKYLIRAAACDALWTRDRAEKAGYVVESTVCPLCQTAQDSVFHRVWECTHPEAKEARDGIAPEWLQKKVAEDKGNPLWINGWMAHPIGWPKADQEANSEVRDAEGTAVLIRDTNFAEAAVFVGDGSCYPHLISGLSRAGMAIACYTVDLKLLYTVVMSLPASVFQSAQGAEHGAAALAAQFSEGPWSYWTDCMGVVNTMNSSWQRQLCSRAMHAGTRRFAKAQMGTAQFMQAYHVPAHRSDDEIQKLEAEEKQLAQANALVDTLAKEGAGFHQQATEEQQQELRVALTVQKGAGHHCHCTQGLSKRGKVP